MKIRSILKCKKITLILLTISIIFLALAIPGCGDEYSSSSDAGSYTCTLTWPEDVPTLETASRSSQAIDCDAAGIATVAFDFYDGSGTFLIGDEWSCSLHKGTVHGIPAGSNRRLVATGENASGKVLYRGEQTGITIVADQTKKGGEIKMAYVYWSMLNLPDTGQTQLYTSTFGEDSDYTINPPSYTDNGDGTVTDNVSTLMWQQADDDTTRTWDEACTYCDSLTLAGYLDWRLPSKKELMSIVDYSTYNPSIDTTYFTGTDASFYWSSPTYALHTSYAWGVDFYLGYVLFGVKYGPHYVRCVRAGQ